MDEKLYEKISGVRNDLGSTNIIAKLNSAIIFSSAEVFSSSIILAVSGPAVGWADTRNLTPETLITVVTNCYKPCFTNNIFL